MKIQLHIDGQLHKEWHLSDIREDYTEAGLHKWQEQIDTAIEKIKRDLVEELVPARHQFYAIYESNLNYMNISDLDIKQFKKADLTKSKTKQIHKLKKAS